MEHLDLTGHGVANRGMTSSSCVLVSMGSHLCWVNSGGVVKAVCLAKAQRVPNHASPISVVWQCLRSPCAGLEGFLISVLFGNLQ